MWHPNIQFPPKLADGTAEEKLDYFTNNFSLNHKNLFDCFEELKSVLFRHEQYPLINIVGPTGVGKTELARKLVKYVSQKKFDSNGEGSLDVIYYELPLHGANRFDWKGFYRSLLSELLPSESSMYSNKRLPIEAHHGKGYNAKMASEAELKKLLETRLKESTKPIVIIDESSHFFMYSERCTEKVLDILKSISNKSGCQFILIGTYESLRSISWSGQLSRRTHNIHFRRYIWDFDIPESTVNHDFIASYSGLLSHAPYELSDELIEKQTIQAVYTLCCGNIGILFQIISRAIIDRPEHYKLKLKDLTQVAPRHNELARIAQEISEGESYFEQANPKEIQELLKVGCTEKIPKTTKKKSTPKNKPGVRHPTRDKVGL